MVGVPVGGLLVDVPDAEQELAGAFGIQSIPSLLFIPKEGKPQMAAGALPKSTLKSVIDKELLVAAEVE